MKRKTVVWLVLALVLGLSLVVASPGWTASQDGRLRVWVEYQPGTKALVDRLLQRAEAEFHYNFDDINAFVVTLPDSQVARVLGDRNVVMVEEDARRYLDSQTVPYGIDMVQARDVWDANRDGTIDAGAPTGANRLVCVIDSGLYTQHEDIQGINITGGYPSNWNTDSCGHGTHVVGTLAAVNNSLGVVGVTPGTTSLYIVKVFGDNCAWTYASTLADAANRCSSAGAKIISMSLGGGTSNKLEERTFNNLNSNGILSIAAAGNTGVNEMHYPASYAAVMGVGAVDQNKQIASFSTFNSDVEISAPGVGVLSTVPYFADDRLTVDGVDYNGNHVEYAAYGTANGVLANGGICDATNSAWSGKVVLCERGTVSFYDKVMNVQNSGGKAAVLYNNAPGNFLGTLGDGNSSTIVAISLSQEDGQWLIANKLGVQSTVTSNVSWNVSSYEYYDGTSMATPHVSAVAALVWSWKTSLTNTQIRDALKNSAEDLGTTGRDNYYGYGLVQAYDAWVYLGGGGTPSDTPPTAMVTAPVEGATVSGTVTVTATATDDKGVNQVQFYVDDVSIGADTNGGDGWSVSWNTTTVANGAHVVKAIATDTIGQTGQDTNNVTVNNPTTTQDMHVGDLDGSKSGTNRWSATVTITVHDAAHNPVASVSVSGNWSKCSVTKSNIPRTTTSVTFSVTGLSKSGWTYVSASNHDPDGDSNGTNITITK
jgi:serine protease